MRGRPTRALTVEWTPVDPIRIERNSTWAAVCFPANTAASRWRRAFCIWAMENTVAAMSARAVAVTPTVAAA